MSAGLGLMKLTGDGGVGYDVTSIMLKAVELPPYAPPFSVVGGNGP